MTLSLAKTPTTREQLDEAIRNYIARHMTTEDLVARAFDDLSAYYRKSADANEISAFVAEHGN